MEGMALALLALCGGAIKVACDLESAFGGRPARLQIMRKDIF
jgi:hypothetical protein